MMTLLGLAAIGIACGLLLARGGRSRPANPAAPSPAATAPPDWRAAASEGPTMRQAVDAMAHHASLLRQASDAWLVQANQWVREPQTFRANVLRAQAMATVIDDECWTVVNHVRELERQRDGAAVFDLRRDRAHALADWADALQARMRARLDAAAAAQGLDPAALLEAALRRASAPSADAVQQLAQRHADVAPLSLEEVVA